MNFLLIVTILIAATLAGAQETIVYINFDKDIKATGLKLTKYAKITDQAAPGKRKSLQGSGQLKGLLFHTLANLQLPVKGGFYYKLEGKVKCSKTLIRKNTHIQLISNIDRKKYQSFAPWSPHNGIAFREAQPIGNNWYKGSNIIYIPPGTKTAKLRIGAYLTKGQKVYFDDIKLSILPPRLDAKYKILCNDQNVIITSNASSLLAANPKQSLKLNISVNSSNKKKLSIEQKLTSNITNSSIDISKFTRGKYTILVEALLDRKVLDKKQLQFQIFRNEAWMNNELGILAPQAPAPKPWTDLNFITSNVDMGFAGGPAPENDDLVNSNDIKTIKAIECWGRKYRFKNILPSKIYSNGENLLYAPIKMILKTATGEINILNGKLFLNKKSAQKGSCSFKFVSNKLKVSGTMDIEFDGMMKYTIKIIPIKPVKIQKLYIEFPIKKEFSTHFICPTLHGFRSRSKIDRKTENWSIENFQPVVWLGSYDKGLCWFAESSQNFNISDNYFECNSQDEVRTLKINIIDRSIKIKKTIDYTFGLLATPIKPQRPEYKSLNFRTPVQMNFGLIWSTKNTTKYFGFPELNKKYLPVLKRAEKNWENIAKGSGRAKTYLFYTTPQFASMLLPEYTYFRQNWRKNQPQIIDAGVFTPIIKIDAEDETWQNLFIAKTYELYKQTGLNGLYYDGGGSTKNIKGKWNIFGMRKFLKRLYIMTHKNDPNALIMSHTGETIPLTSFYDVTLSGEQYRKYLFTTPYYLDFMSLKQFRQEQAISFGNVKMLLGQFRGPSINDPKYTVHFMGLALLHNMIIYPNFVNAKVYQDIEKRRILFGKKSANFIPYWRNSAIKCNNQAIKISYYRKGESILMVVMNTVKQPAKGIISVDAKALKLKGKKTIEIYDPLSKQKRQGKFNGKIPFNIKEYSMLMISIK